MATKYFALLTNIGAAKLANATALGAKVEITQMAVGDGNGVLPTPNPAQTALTHELRRAQLNMLTIDPVNTNQIIAEQVIPEDVGGWWIREIGLFDKDGDMIAVANCAETYKPQLQEGSGRVQVIRVILIVSSTEVVTLKIDPSVVLATRKYVDDAVIEVKAYADNLMREHLDDENPHTQYPLIANAMKELADLGVVNDTLKNLGLMDSTGYQGRLIDVKVFKSSGAYKPTRGTKKIQFQAWGGGASGAATQITSGNAASSGGGGAAYIEGFISVSADTEFVATVGAGGGSVQPGTTNGINGGITALGNLFTMTAAGGGGATFNGRGGSVSANLTDYPELVVIHAYAGGNAMGGVSENVGGYGGASFGSAPSNPHTTAGEPNYLPGGGGAGGATTGGTSGASGSGGPGMIIIWEYA